MTHDSPLTVSCYGDVETLYPWSVPLVFRRVPEETESQEERIKRDPKFRRVNLPCLDFVYPVVDHPVMG